MCKDDKNLKKFIIMTVTVDFPFTYLLQFLNAGCVGPLWMFITLQRGLHSWVYPPLLRLPPGLRLLLLRFLEGLHIDRHHGHGVVELLAVGKPGVRLLQKDGIHFNLLTN